MAKAKPKDNEAPTPGQKLQAARQAKGWSQPDLAERIGVSRQHVSAVESWERRKRPAFDWFLKHAAVWDELSLDRWWFVEDASRPVCCPTCSRPFP